MKKILTLALALIVVLSLAACVLTKKENSSSNSENNSSQSNENITPEKIEETIAKALGDGYLATVPVSEDDIFLSPLGSLDLTKLDSYVAKMSMVPSVNLDTVAIVKCKDASYADEVVKAFNESYSQTVSYVSQYPFGTAKVLGARIYKSGDLVIYVLAGASYDGEDSEAEAKLAASEYEKIDEAIKSVLGTIPENLAKASE